MLIQKLPKEKASELIDGIKKLEIDLIKQGTKNGKNGKNGKEEKEDRKKKQNYLFFTKDATASLKMKSLSEDRYKSLIIWAKENFAGLKGSNSENQMKKFRDFLDKCPKNKNQQRDKSQRQYMTCKPTDMKVKIYVFCYESFSGVSKNIECIFF